MTVNFSPYVNLIVPNLKDDKVVLWWDRVNPLAKNGKFDR